MLKNLKLENDIFNKVSDLQNIYDKKRYKFKLIEIEMALANYTAITKKIHPLNSQTIKLYEKLWRL